MSSPSAPFGQAAPRWDAPRSVLPVICTLVLFLALATSCASRAAKRAAEPSATSTTTDAFALETRVGVVRAVGTGERFVLIETPSALSTSTLPEGQLLHCRPPEAQSSAATADLRVAHERHQSLVVANVVAGDPTVGAVVYAAPASMPTPTPAAGSVSSLTTAPLSGLFPPRKP